MDSAIDSRLSALGAITRAPGALQRLGEVLRQADDWELLRINPLRFAERHGLDPQDAVDLFVCGARVGLFDLRWTTVCPLCGGIGHSTASIAGLAPDGIRCALCDRDVPAALDEQVEVSFTVSPDVRPLAIDPLGGPEAFGRYWFTDNVVIPAPVAQRVQQAMRGFAVVAPGAEATLAAEAVPGDYRLVSVQHNALHRVHVREGLPACGEARVVLTERGFSPESTEAGPGPLSLRVTNDTGEPLALMLAFADPEIRNLVDRLGLQARPFLTASALLNTQAFREHFSIQELVPGLRLAVRSLVVLFTDLKDSTSLYDRSGDVSAYDFVRAHFELLTECVRSHSGGVVKTMGDAVMATFSTPRHGAEAALEMVARVDELCRSRETPARLKVGLHEGPALVISADDRLDYFGQTVNIAARVQALAGGGEVCLTRPLHGAPGVAELFAAQGFTPSFESAALKGIAEPTPVVRMRA